MHRDVKPSNILIDRNGVPKLTDFDLAHALDTTGGTRTGAMLGTVIYAAPELMENAKDAGVPADVFGLGMTAVFALYGAALGKEVLRHAERFVSGLEIGSACKNVLSQAITWNLKRRWNTVAEFCQLLRDAFDEDTASLPSTVQDRPSQTTSGILVPEHLGRYEIIGELGKGAMGVVYLAQDPIIHRQLAIKTFRMAYSAKEKEVQQFRERFLREAQAIGRLSHPNIVTVHDVGQEDDEYFIAMEYIKGVNLKQRMLSTDEPLPLDFVIDVTAQIAEGLACAHEEGIVHRDIKPANIIITQSRRVKITDFGIARVEQSNLTVAGQLLGTPNYMAPEQIQGKTVDARTDIFSLGVLLYEMLTRKKPFAGENLTQVSHRL